MTDRIERGPAWTALREHAAELASLDVREELARDPDRARRMAVHWDGFLVDLAKNRVVDETFERLFALAREADVEGWRERMFRGERINTTEDRAAFHVALRHRGEEPMRVDGEDVMPAVRQVLEAMGRFCAQVRGGEWTGHTGRRIRDVVNLGIGGSDLGPRLVAEALRPYQSPELRVHFVSNVDGRALAETLRDLDPESTLFIVASKSFGTQETLTNARSARRWLRDSGAPEQAVARHFVAVSSHEARVRAFGIDPRHMFRFWDWVGGRTSLWSAIGLPVALAVGMERFDELLAGAHAMDSHFREAPLERNLPVLLALLGVWYTNFLGAGSHAILPYAEDLRLLPAYLQQLDMESNGKGVDREGRRVGHMTGPIVWGAAGTDGQHAFFQLLHQGTRLVSCDFLAPVEAPHSDPEHQRILLANFLAQPEALLRGRDPEQARRELEAEGLSGEALERLLPHRVFEGNRPTTSILFRRLDPWHLGALLALYEHKVFVQGVIWQVNSFDQWGVELGKQLAGNLLDELREGAELGEDHDASTRALLRHVRTRGTPDEAASRKG